MKQIQRAGCFFFFIMLMAFTAIAQQSIEVKPEKSTILLGEPLQVTVKVTGAQAFKPLIPDSLGSFEILDAQPPKTTTGNGATVVTQQLVITSFDSGQQRIPPIAIEGNNSFVSSGVDILVNTIPADSTQKYGDIKQIIDLDSPPQWPYMLGLLAVTIASGLGLFYLNKKLAMPPLLASEEPVDAPVPVNVLIQQLEQLRRQWQQQEVTPVALGNQLMEIFRKYLAGKGLNVRSKTGEEMIVFTKGRFSDESWQGIAQTVRLCNAMRFGKYQATVQEGVEGIDGFQHAIVAPNP